MSDLNNTAGTAENGYARVVFSMCALSFFVLALGVALGSVYCVKRAGVSTDGANNFTAITAALATGNGRTDIALNLLYERVITALIILLPCVFKPARAAALAAVLREGFVTGFTLSSALCAYGIKGLLITATVIIETAAVTACTVALCGAALAYSVEKEKFFKKFLIITFAAAISIFCAASFSRGYISTTFIKFVYSEIL